MVATRFQALECVLTNFEKRLRGPDKIVGEKNWLFRWSSDRNLRVFERQPLPRSNSLSPFLSFSCLIFRVCDVVQVLGLTLCEGTGVGATNPPHRHGRVL